MKRKCKHIVLKRHGDDYRQTSSFKFSIVYNILLAYLIINQISRNLQAR